VIALLLVALIAVSLSSSLIIIPSAKAQASAPPNTSLLTIQGKDTNGQTLTMYLTFIEDQDGNNLAVGTPPLSFRLNNSQTYTLYTFPNAVSANLSTGSHFVACKFDHWSDTGNTSNVETISITSDTNITAWYTCPPITTTINVSTVDLAGNPIAGYYTVLYDQSGTTMVDAQFSPASFNATIGQTYTVLVDDYGRCSFDYWQDTGSTVRQRDVTPNTSSGGGGVSLVAVYDCGPTSTIKVTTVNAAGNDLPGFFATLMSPSPSGGVLLQSCFSPCSFTVNNGEAYVITVANFGSETFDRWSDGGGTADPWGGSRIVAVPDGSTSTTMSLIAVYRP
jgi:hypothetical protein